MTSKVIPLDTNEKTNFEDGWGQWVVLDIHEEPISNLEYLTTSLVDLEEGNYKKKNNKSCNEFCIIC